MNHDQIALYLNDHPEFFNHYPELLARIKSISDEEIPLKPVKTLNIAGRILKRAQADTEHIRNQLVSFMEITQANEKIQEHLTEIERIILYSLNFSQMVQQLREEITRRFNIPGVQIILIDGEDHMMEQRLQQRMEQNALAGLQFKDAATVTGWFDIDRRPALRADLPEGSEIFREPAEPPIRSEAVIPILLHGNLIGAFALGSENLGHFYEGLRTDYLERTADKLGIAIENILLLDLMKNQPILDATTGLYNVMYLDPLLRREFGWARCSGKGLSLIKMHIDSFAELVNTYGTSRIKEVLKEAGKMLAETSRGGDIMIGSGGGDFWVLLPETTAEGAGKIAERIRKTLVTHMFAGMESDCLRVVFGVAATPGKGIETPADLLAAAAEALAKTPAGKDHKIAV